MAIIIIMIINKYIRNYLHGNKLGIAAFTRMFSPETITEIFQPIRINNRPKLANEENRHITIHCKSFQFFRPRYQKFGVYSCSS